MKIKKSIKIIKKSLTINANLKQLKNHKNCLKWSICKQSLKEKHQTKFHFGNWKIDENQSRDITNQSNIRKNVKSLKNCPKWSICKQSWKENHQKKLNFENQQINQNHSNIIKNQSKSQKSWGISKMAQRDRCVKCSLPDCSLPDCSLPDCSLPLKINENEWKSIKSHKNQSKF